MPDLMTWPGAMGGSLGETSRADLAASLFLMARRIISWHPPWCWRRCSFRTLFNALTLRATPGLFHIFSGGSFGVFIATDCITSPVSKRQLCSASAAARLLGHTFAGCIETWPSQCC
jgi:Na+-translocating ferredoxin:NAD+ oxidoreductase RnfD subunit